MTIKEIKDSIQQWNEVRMTSLGLNFLTSGSGLEIRRSEFEAWKDIQNEHNIDIDDIEVHMYIGIVEFEITFYLVDSYSDKYQDYEVNKNLFVKEYTKSTFLGDLEKGAVQIPPLEFVTYKRNETIEDEDGNEVVDGMFLFNDDFQTIEQVTDFVNQLLDIQEKDGMPDGPDGQPLKGYLFLWDSVGSIPCQMTFEGKGGSMHNARVLADKIGMGLTSRITNSKRDDYPYDNTMVIVNQPWVELPDNPFGQPKIKAKGGEAIWLNSALVFLFGNQKNAGISQLDATKNGRKVAFATKTKISILKNHVNGLGYKDGKIIATPHGYIEDTPDSIKKYKEEYAEYWKDVMGGDAFDLKESKDSLGFME